MSRTGISRLRNIRHSNYERSQRQETLQSFLTQQALRLAPTARDIEFTADNTTNTLTATAHGFSTGEGPYLLATNGGTLPTELNSTTPYFIVVLTDDTFQLNTEPGGPIVEFTDDGSGGVSVYAFATQYEFEDSGLAIASDLSGNSYGATYVNYSEAMHIEGVVGNAVAIAHASNQNVTFPAAVGQLGKDSAWGMSFWSKLDQRAGMITRQGPSTNYKGYSISMTSIADTGTDNQMEIFFGNADGDDQIRVQVDGDILDNTWHHHVIAYDGSNTKEGFTVYRDGVSMELEYALSADTITGTVIDPTAVMSLSSWGAGTTNFDQLIFFGTAIDQNVVNTLYNSGNGISSPLYAPGSDIFLPFDANLESPTDVSDNERSVAIPNYDVGMYVAGDYKDALAADGNALVYSEALANYENSQAFTVAFKARRISSVTEGEDFTLCDHIGSGPGWSVTLKAEADDNVRIAPVITDGTDSIGTQIGATTNQLPLDTWVSIVCIYDGLNAEDSWSVYVNTVLAATTDFGTAPISSSLDGTAPFTLSSNAKYQIDSFGAWPKALNTTEIAELHNNYFGGLSGLVRTQPILGHMTKLEAPEADLFLPFDDIAAIPVDASPNAHQGTITNYDASMYRVGPYGNALKLNAETLTYLASAGVGDFGKTDAFSIIFKIRITGKLDTSGESIWPVVHRENDNSGNGFSVLVEGDTPGARIGFSMGDDAAGVLGSQQTNGIIAYEDKAWHSVVINYDGSNTTAGIDIYTDNVQAAQTDFGAPLTGTADPSALDLVINTGDQCEIDCVGIFPRVLTTAEIELFTNSDFDGVTAFIRRNDSVTGTGGNNQTSKKSDAEGIYDLQKKNKPVTIASIADIDDLN